MGGDLLLWNQIPGWMQDPYLKDFRYVIVCYLPNRVLCSQTAGLLVVPRVSKSRMGGRAFSY